MAADFFLEIADHKGEATDATHKDKIQLQSFSWGCTNAGVFASNTGGGAGKAVFQDFNFAMIMNKASPELFLSCATGKHIPKATLFCRKSGGKQEEYLKVYFTDILISSYQTGAAEGANSLPMEQISFNFAIAKFEYAAQKKEGGLDTPVIRGYDIKQQKKV